jgi:hypothetical protein
LIVAVPFEGVTVSHDHGCTWEHAPAPLAEQFAVDVTLDPRSTSNLLVLTSTADASLPAGSDPEFINLLVETRDNARSWHVFGSPLPRDFIAAAFDAAPSQPDRIYVSGVVGDPPSAVVERSDDRGASWTRFTMPVPDRPLGVFLSAIHPRDADRLWVRVLFDDLGGSSPTSLYRTDDGGETWTEVAATADGMLGFALSPDGETLAYGSLAGVFSGPAAGNVFAPLAMISNRCLTWSASGLYACGTEPTDPFAVGLARSPPARFEPLYRLAQTCPQDCPEASQFGLTCLKPWSDPQGVAALTRARGENCGGSESAGGSSAAGVSPIGPRSTNARGACTLAYSASGGATLWVIVVCVAASARRRSTRVKPQNH